jgi:hypothetical protein
VKTPPNVSVEDLGTKGIQGFQAHGLKITQLGAEKDGEWNGRPLRAIEEWRSDELAAPLRMVISDFRTERETRSDLSNIRRVEPGLPHAA